MGYEYMLDFEVANRAEADQLLLRKVAGFEGFDPQYELYSFQRRATGALPDADAKIEIAGIYICDYGCGFPVVEDIRAAFAAVGLDAVPREL